MYFAMKSIGFDDVETMRHMPADSEKWRFIEKIANEFGFQGIQVTDGSFYGEFGLPLDNLPDCIKSFRLTYHLGEAYDLSDDIEYAKNDSVIESAFRSAVNNGMEDVSIHPPLNPSFVSPDSPDLLDRRCKSKNNLTALIEKWLPKFGAEGITFSMEDHVGGNAFLFDGLEKYAEFVRSYPDLGVLTDISHKINDGYSISDIFFILDGLKITGMHLSDAFANIDVRLGTHLPVGKGNIDFAGALRLFRGVDKVYGALEMRAAADEIRSSLSKLMQYSI